MTFDIKTTKKHSNADALSRLLVPIGNEELNEESYDVTELYMIQQLDSLPVSSKEIQRETVKDTTLKVVYDMNASGWPASANNLNEALKAYFTRRNEISIYQGCLFWGIRVIIPQNIRSRVLEELHEGHSGIVKMKTVACILVWWPGIDKDLETLVKSCKGCQDNRPMPPEAPIHPWEWPQRAWQRIHVDFAGPFQGSMFLVAVDAFSKWPEVVQMSTTTADRTVDVLRRIISRNGLPDSLVSDNGPQFVFETFQDFMKYNGFVM
ncbi:uncharacterized protein K02A2.6-like [Ostrea edulis]|uniref:uncharacterized protein K02A2.6-like n=1 Tax=Ostrea edulis TaxID=37623 RepID=UPI0024AF38C6|nr:uncharacterized protein K02A2.6-like [Ostrea edulis]